MSRPKINGALRDRLRFIDFALGTYGYINRSHLMDYFGISEAQASVDINDYAKLAPKNIEYDSSQKFYMSMVKSFKRIFP